MTLDTDFADIRSYAPGGHPGFIVFRLRKQDRDHLLSVARALLPLFDREPLTGRTWVVEEAQVRIRGD